jgi:hypothetical protein
VVGRHALRPPSVDSPDTATASHAAIDLESGTDATGTVLAAATLDPFRIIPTDGITFTAARVAFADTLGMRGTSVNSGWDARRPSPAILRRSPSRGRGPG